MKKFVVPMDVVGGLLVDPSVERKLRALGQEQAFLRIAVEGGGCSGFQYKIELDAPAEDDDVLRFDENCGVVVDPVSQPFLKDAVLKYVEDVVGSRFAIDNPNVSSACGCGISFAV
jgi:iron-sulfur cluster assembly accessory protein